MTAPELELALARELLSILIMVLLLVLMVFTSLILT